MRIKHQKWKILLTVAIAVLIAVSFFDWSFWSWIGIAGIVLISIGWYLKK